MGQDTYVPRQCNPGFFVNTFWFSMPKRLLVCTLLVGSNKAAPCPPKKTILFHYNKYTNNIADGGAGAVTRTAGMHVSHMVLAMLWELFVNECSNMKFETTASERVFPVFPHAYERHKRAYESHKRFPEPNELLVFGAYEHVFHVFLVFPALLRLISAFLNQTICLFLALINTFFPFSLRF